MSNARAVGHGLAAVAELVMPGPRERAAKI
ncbi:hypothetical protein FHR22_003719 [Sphingopyxis panaciterrae]|nr:hypothetical protein [Sphingopyxis panaciterrae]